MEKVAAVVVSHNHYTDLIACIKAIRNQTHKPDAIIVVNNGSTDFSSVWLDQQEDIVHLYQDNLGVAGGFNNGMSWACQHGFDWLWCMDDQGFPDQQSLEYLLKNQGLETALINSIPVDKTDKITIVRKIKNYKFVNQISEPVIQNISHLFNGSLIHKNIVAKVGLPYAYLCEKGYESEYYYRITHKYQIPSKTITASKHYHQHSKSYLKNEWNVKADSDVYFFLRNRFAVYSSKHKYKTHAIGAYVIFIFQFMTSIFWYQQNDRFRKFNFVFWPVMDVLTNNYQISAKYVSQKMNNQYGNKFSRMFITPIRKYFCNLFVPSIKETSTPLTV